MRPSGLPQPPSKAYLEEVMAFYVGLAALQVGDDVRADSTRERDCRLPSWTATLTKLRPTFRILERWWQTRLPVLCHPSRRLFIAIS
jgi:hypothetical protein